MKIILSTSTGTKFATVQSWEEANEAAKAIFKKDCWSDLYYDIFLNEDNHVSGSIDLEPQSFHKSHQNKIFTWHLKTFWSNISKATPKSYLSQEDINYCKSLLNYLPQ